MNNQGLLDAKAIQTLRVLACEEINKAKSGHPGIALGAAPIIHTLYHKVLKVLPRFSTWPERDRFIMSAGHGSSLLYAVLHLLNFGIGKSDLQQFRQRGSITPGHPELGVPGIDASTGPLGQGIANGVGMAIASLHLAKKFNREEKIIDNFVYVLCGDGDLQEGIAQEAISLAGNLELSNLIVLYDSNDIQLDGEVSNANTENTKMKFQAVNWNYILVKDGENCEDILAAINQASLSSKPTLIEVKTTIGSTSSLAGSCQVHGSPLPDEEVRSMRNKLGGEPFSVPQDVASFYQSRIEQLEKQYLKEQEKQQKFAQKHPELFKAYQQQMAGNYPLLLEDIKYDETYNKATRVTGGNILKEIAKQNPMIMGGAADVVRSTQASCNDSVFTKATREGRNIHFGVREHAMAAICNGLALYGGLRPFCSTFMSFVDYMKPAIRMACLMQLSVVYILTHDTIYVGEDGPTHQPIEQLTTLRSIPNLNVIRPASAEETKQGYQIAFTSTGPTALILTRQSIQEIDPDCKTDVKSGAYIFKKEKHPLNVVLLATGSEVSNLQDIYLRLSEEGFGVRLVSMPSMYLYDGMLKDYRDEILPKGVMTIAVEASEASHMYKYADYVINIETFGISAKPNDVLDACSFTKEKIYEKIKNYML